MGADLDETIDNTVTFLDTVYNANSTAGSYLTSIDVVRNGNKIEISIISTAPANLITRWEMRTLGTFRFITETPCQTIFLTNFTALDNLSNTNLRLWNVDLSLSSQIGTPNRFDIEVQRGFRYRIENSSLVNLLYFSTPLSINPLNVTVVVNLTTVVINANPTIVVYGSTYSMDDLYYSLNGTNWQFFNNTFTDLEDGNYTAYIRDRYGCIQSVNFTISNETNVNTAPAYDYISESNSIRFVKDVERGNCGIYKNVFNTLSSCENTELPYPEIQNFQSCDNITTQVLSSYENVSYIINDVEEIATKIVANIGISDKRECLVFNDGYNLCLIFFTGLVFQYGTTDVVSTYDLNGSLPQWGVIGNFVETNYGNLQIINIGVNDDGNRYLILNSNQGISTPVNQTVQLIYNRDNFDIWEFTVPMNDFLNTDFNVVVKHYNNEPSDLFPDVYWVSEKISVRERWEESIEVIWKMTKNTDIYYASGIEMKGRFYNWRLTQLSDGDVDVLKVDSKAVLIDSNNYNAVELTIDSLTTGMARKLKLALKHDFLVIENLFYILAENPEIERYGVSNLYTLTAKLIEAGDVFNSQTARTNVIYTQGELIGLLSGDSTNEYIRIL